MPLTAHISAEKQRDLLHNDLWALHEKICKLARLNLDDNPTPSPLEAMRMYIGSDNATELNQYLRGRPSDKSGALQKMNAAMLRYFEEHARTLHEMMVMRRWVSTTSDYSPGGFAPGTVLVERAWLSLTTDSTHDFFTSRTDVEYEIALPVGSRVIAGSARENEFILPPNSAFRIVEVIDTRQEVEGRKKYLIKLVACRVKHVYVYGDSTR